MNEIELDGDTLEWGEEGLKVSDSFARDKGEWHAHVPYNTGDIVSRERKVYRCNYPHANANFLSEYWDTLTYTPTISTLAPLILQALTLLENRGEIQGVTSNPDQVYAQRQQQQDNYYNPPSGWIRD